MSDKIMNFTRVVGTVIFSLQSVGYIGETTLTPENLDKIYNKADEYLHKNFGTALEYAEALRQVDQLGMDIASGAAFLPSNYSGKLWYSFVDAVKDVLFPENHPDTIPQNSIIWRYFPGGYITYSKQDKGPVNPVLKLYSKTSTEVKYSIGNVDDYLPNNGIVCYFQAFNTDGTRYLGVTSSYDFYGYWSGSKIITAFSKDYTIGEENYEGWMRLFFGHGVYVPNIPAKTADKIKLPTRLPQTIINNINNYNGTTNLEINPTPEELPKLPDNYNPNTDPLPDLPGYEDVTPDQPGTTDPEPTPTPTPEPTPEPTPNPDYNGDKWVNPIGDFMDGLLKFMKAAFVPTLTLNLDALNTMLENLGEKFPFSLPGDLVRMFSIFQAEPKPFAFDWELDFTAVGAGTIPIKGDISMFDEYAPLFRNLAFIGFLIGLAWRTFGMFFGGGDE